MKNIRISVIVLLIVQALWPASSSAADAERAGFDDALTKQEQIYRSRGESRPDGYVIDRSLLSYVYTLSAGFDRALAALGATDRWLEIGAGRGQAVLDYFAGKIDAMNAAVPAHVEDKAQVVAISIEDRRTPVWQQTAATLAPDRMQYLHGKRLREYAPAELGRFKLITDVIGGFSYSVNLSDFMATVLSLLEVNSDFYTVLQDVHSREGTNKPHYAGAPYLTEISKPDGSKVKICSWLQSIGCVQVTCDLKAGWKPPIEVYHIRKVCANTQVPLLITTHFEAGTPPERGFLLAN